MLADRSELKRLLWVLVAVALVAVLLVLVYRYLFIGKLVVQTDQGNTIIIRSSSNKTVAQSTSNLSASLSAGTYVVAVYGHIATAEKTVTVSAHKTTNTRLPTPSYGQPESVVPGTISGIVAGSDQLRYLNADFDRIDSIDSSGAISHIGDNLSLVNVHWSNTSLGIGQDQSGHLFTISATGIKQLSFPGHPNVTATSYDVSKTGTIYMATDTSIYSGTLGGTFKKVYDTTGTASLVVASTNGFLLAETKVKGADQPQSSAILSAISSSGQLRKQITLPVSDSFGASLSAAWNPSGDKVLVVNGDQSTLYDAALHEITGLPGKTITSPVWLDDNSLLYGSASNLWFYSLETKTAGIISNLPTGATISELGLASDHSYVYLSAQTPNNSALYRVGLHNQPASSLIYKLGVFLPEDLPVCHVTYTNFATLAIILQPYIASAYATCQQSATSYLQDDQIDVSKLRFIDGDVLSQSD